MSYINAVVDPNELSLDPGRISLQNLSRRFSAKHRVRSIQPMLRLLHSPERIEGVFLD
jgi:hypothetical protein